MNKRSLEITCESANLYLNKYNMNNYAFYILF